MCRLFIANDHSLLQKYTSAMKDRISVKISAPTHVVPTPVHAALAIPLLSMDSAAQVRTEFSLLWSGSESAVTIMFVCQMMTSAH